MLAQSRLGSFAESMQNIAIGFAIQSFANWLVLPLFGFNPSIADLVGIGAIMTIVSVVRSYGLRRWHEHRRAQKAPPDFLYIVSEIAAERQRQIGSEGHTLASDDGYVNGQLAAGAAAYAFAGSIHGRDERARLLKLFVPHIPDVSGVAQMLRDLWPWGLHHFKPTHPRRDLIKAGAMIVAEIGRIDRAKRRS